MSTSLAASADCGPRARGGGSGAAWRVAGQASAEEADTSSSTIAMLIAASATLKVYQRDVADAHVHEVDDVADAQRGR